MQQYKSIIIGSALLMGAGFSYAEKKVLTAAAYPAVDQVVRDSVAVWSKDNPDQKESAGEKVGLRPSGPVKVLDRDGKRINA